MRHCAMFKFVATLGEAILIALAVPIAILVIGAPVALGARLLAALAHVRY